MRVARCYVAIVARASGVVAAKQTLTPTASIWCSPSCVRAWRLKRAGGFPFFVDRRLRLKWTTPRPQNTVSTRQFGNVIVSKLIFLSPFSLSLSLSLSFFLSLSLSRMIDALRNETNLFLTESLTPSEVASLSSTNLMIISLWYQVYSLWFVIFILKIWGRFLCITAKGLQEERKLNCRDEGDDRSGIGASRMKQIAWNWWITILKFKPDGLEFNSGSISVLQFNIPACTEV